MCPSDEKVWKTLFYTDILLAAQ